MAIAVRSTYLAYVAQVLGITAIILVLIWTISFRGGLAWEAANKNLIFNVMACVFNHKQLKLVFGIGLRSPEWLAQLHPLLILLGFIVLGGEAIITYKVLPLRKEVKKIIHLVLHAIALILGIIGVYTAFKFHNESNIANLYSLHSWIGIGITVLYGVQWVYGFLVFFFPGGTSEIRRGSLPWHVLFGLFVYMLAVGNAALGFLEKLTFLENSGLAKYGSEALLVNCTAIITILFGAFVIFTLLSEPVTTTEDDYSYSAI